MKIYHNPRCSKSRQGLVILSQSNLPFEIVNYLKEPISKPELIEIINLLGISPIELVRKNELIWKENFKGQELNDDAIVEAMIQHPKLIERPIVVHNGKAVIGRPPATIKELL